MQFKRKTTRRLLALTLAAIYCFGTHAAAEQIFGNGSLAIDGQTVQPVFDADNEVIGAANVGGGAYSDVDGSSATLSQAALQVSSGTIYGIAMGGSFAQNGASLAISGNSVATMSGGDVISYPNTYVYDPTLMGGSFAFYDSTDTALGQTYAVVQGNSAAYMNGGTAEWLIGGGCAQENAAAQASVLSIVEGKSSVFFNAGTVTWGIYGGGWATGSGKASASVKGGTEVFITENAATTGNVFGGSGAYLGAQTDISGGTHVVLDGGTVSGYGSILGGSESSGGSDASVVGGTNVEIKSGNVIYVYGAGADWDGNHTANTVDEASVAISGGTVSKYVVGGGYYADVTGSTKVEISGGTIGGNVYGGNEGASVVGGDSTVIVSGGKIGGYVYAGGTGAGSVVNGSGNVIVDKASVRGVYDVANGATLVGDFNVTLQNGGSVVQKVENVSGDTYAFAVMPEFAATTNLLVKEGSYILASATSGVANDVKAFAVSSLDELNVTLQANARVQSSASASSAVVSALALDSTVASHTLSGGQVIAMATNTRVGGYSEAYGVCVWGGAANVLLQDGASIASTASVSDGGAVAYGIFSINGVNATISSASGITAKASGVGVQNVTLVDSMAAAVYADSGDVKISVSHSTLSAVADTSAYGIYARNGAIDATFDNAAVNASGKEAAYAVYSASATANDKLSIADSKLTGDVELGGGANEIVVSGNSAISGRVLATDGTLTLTVASNGTLGLNVGNIPVISAKTLVLANSGTISLTAADPSMTGTYSITEGGLLNGNVRAYGGTFEGNTFTVGAVERKLAGDFEEAKAVSENERLNVVSSAGDSVEMSFSMTQGEQMVFTNIDHSSQQSVQDLLSAAAFIDENSKMLASWDFKADTSSVTDSRVMLSFVVGSGFNLENFTIWHRSTGESWDLYGADDLWYDGKTLGFSVNSFSEYGVTAVPEPAMAAGLLGLLALLVVARRRK